MSYKDLIKNVKKDEELKSNLDINSIINETNLETNLDTLIQNKIDLLKSLDILSDESANIMEKLECYMYIDDVYKFEKGRYIRWINSNNKLMNGAICVDILFTNMGTNILCKNGVRVFQLKYDTNHFFQLLSEEEQLVLAVNEKLQST